MKNQKEAERAEQQRIKNLVLNYDLHESNVDQIGIDDHLYLNSFPQPNPNIKVKPPSVPIAHRSLSQGSGGGEKHGPSHHQHNAPLHQSSSPANTNPKIADRSGTNRNGQRARKLQLSDVDWYEQKPGPSPKGSGRGGHRRIFG